ncbi:alpha/beta fold hydrolase [Vibrio sp. AK197]
MSDIESTPKHRYTQEQQFAQASSSHIAQLWQQRVEGTITSFDRTSLYWIKLTHPQHTKAIVVINGRIESAWKYQELFYDLYQQGYDIFSYDHRGQGLSGRLTDDPQIGHIDEFNDYLLDMDKMVDTFDLSGYQTRHLLAHSMGGTIATRYIQTHPQHQFDAMALSAPMFGIHLPWYLKPIASLISQLLTACNPKPVYAPGHQAYYPKPFDSNPLNQCLPRYEWFRQLYEDKPELQVGGPSTRWVWQSMMAAKQSIQLTRQIKIPLLLMQAGDDTIVANASHIKFIKKLARTNTRCGFKIIHGARHELLFEQDQYRNQVLDTLLNFFAQYSRHQA